MTQASPQKHILLVEDNRAFRLGMQLTLNHLNCLVDTAENGEDAIQKASLHSYDLIFIDIELPDMNGLEVTRHIRALPDSTSSQAPIVALTGHLEADITQHTETTSIYKFITKPISIPMLTSLLQQLESQPQDMQ